MKTLILYLILVGLPALGVSQIIRVGERIKPPVSLSGSWRLVATPDPICNRSGPDTLSLHVSQSGPALDIRFTRGVHLEGKMEGDGFQAAGRTRVRMRGEVIRDSSEYQLRGTISGAPCPKATDTRMVGLRIHHAGRASGD
jgi:hypothetical protein